MNFRNELNIVVLIEYYEENDYGMGSMEILIVGTKETVKLPFPNIKYNILSEDYSGNIGSFHSNYLSTNDYYKCQIRKDNDTFILEII
jgi:hypothetical protein